MSKFTTRIQGAADTHISQATFIMKELKELLEANTHPICTDDRDKTGAVVTEDIALVDRSFEAQGLLEVLVDVLIEKNLGCAFITTERIYVLLDPRWEKLLTDEYLNGGPAPRETERVGDGLTDQETPQTLTMSLVAGVVSAAGGAAGCTNSGEERAIKC